MKPCLGDVNVFLALLVSHHDHHNLAREWFDDLSAGEAGLCRIVQLSLVRLLGNRSVMGPYTVPAGKAWATIQELLEDERVEFVAESDGLDYAFPLLLNYPMPTPKLVADAYLAAFAISARRRLVTLDAGFRQFSRLDFRVLGQ
jgi:toxin-antitoxin system PIN domain toxin